LTVPQPVRWRRGVYLGIFVVFFLLAFFSGWHIALAKGENNGSGDPTGNNNPCSGPNPPTYCHQSNWSCVGTDVGGCVHNQQLVVYPSGCSPSSQLLSCSGGQCQGKSVFLSCTGCHTGLFEPTNSCTGARNGANYQGSAPWCTGGCPTQSPTPPTSSSQPPPSSSNPPASQSSTPPSSSPPAPSCTPSASTSCSGPYLTGCTGSCTSSGCTGTGVATGYEYCTVDHFCPSYTSSYTQPVTTGTSACQQTVEHQCAWGQPGYAQKEYCLTSPLGGVTDCSGWSAPYYDPKDCPVPTPVGL